MAVKPIPDGYHQVTPMVIVEGAAGLIEFVQAAFGAQERLRIPMPDGSVGHSELTIGDSVIMIADATAEYPAAKNGIHLYVEDTDATYGKAIAAGATSKMEPADQFYGDRSSTVVDAYGNTWSIATHIEEVSEEEAMKRMAAMMPPSA